MIKNVVPFVHEILTNTITKNDIVIDATCGNGNDTLFLANLAKHVYAFDIQDMALTNTKELLIANNHSNFTVLKSSHSNMDKYITDSVKAVTFNLGYLPGSDKSIITNSIDTITAIEKAMELLVPGGLITIILYIGHKGGLSEANDVEVYTKSLSNKEYKVIKYDFINQVKPPYVIVIEKQ